MLLFNTVKRKLQFGIAILLGIYLWLYVNAARIPLIKHGYSSDDWKLEPSVRTESTTKSVSHLDAPFVLPKVKTFGFNTDSELMEEMARRKHRIQETCRKKGLTKVLTFYEDLEEKGPVELVASWHDKDILNFMVVDKIHNFTLTLTEKTASSTGRHIMITIGRSNLRLALLKPKELHMVLKHFKKVVIVREPLYRLVSAWNEKLVTNDNPVWRAAGRDIIKMYRANATADEIRLGYPVTFREFMTFLADTDITTADPHWRPATLRTLPCQIPYDYIIQFENLENEFKSVINILTGSAMSSFPEKKYREKGFANYTNSIPQLIESVPPEILWKVIEKYRNDYEMYGYEIP